MKEKEAKVNGSAVAEASRRPKRAKGRPRKHADARTEFVRVRFSSAELKRVGELAEGDGMTLSEYLRSRGLCEPSRPTVPAVNYSVVGEMNRLGNNLNQLLVLAYANDDVRGLQKELLELLALHRELRGALVGRLLEPLQSLERDNQEA